VASALNLAIAGPCRLGLSEHVRVPVLNLAHFHSGEVSCLADRGVLISLRRLEHIPPKYAHFGDKNMLQH
jgi:hypothetical protein